MRLWYVLSFKNALKIQIFSEYFLATGYNLQLNRGINAQKQKLFSLIFLKKIQNKIPLSVIHLMLMAHTSVNILIQSSNSFERTMFK